MCQTTLLSGEVLYNSSPTELMCPLKLVHARARQFLRFHILLVMGFGSKVFGVFLFREGLSIGIGGADRVGVGRYLELQRSLLGSGDPNCMFWAEGRQVAREKKE